LQLRNWRELDLKLGCFLFFFPREEKFSLKKSARKKMVLQVRGKIVENVPESLNDFFDEHPEVIK